MKTLLFSLLLCATASATAATSAVEPLITRTTVDAHRLDVTLANLEQATTTVRLTNLDEDAVFFEERIRQHNGYAVSLSLDDLPAGRYVLSVTKGDVVRSQVILKSDTGIMCSAWK